MQNRTKIHTRIRKVISGTAQRPRLSVYRSLTNVYAQLIDDTKGLTLVSANSLKEKGSKLQKAQFVGEVIAKLAKEKKIKSASFDRGGFRYAGVVKVLAESARNAGLEI
ncbi:50S ribosomal protein L18 [Candidatus Berkelbacteria bacterium]|nr:50S ribosomal protein L18 [Candidatus Berkelbacteria bacterium]